jgi:hypothetical protein
MMATDPLGPDLAQVMEHERAQRAQDKAAFERDQASAANIGTHADAYIQGVNECGEAVVYVPGELLPPWVAEQVNAGRAPLEEAAAGVRIRRLERKQTKGQR